MGENMKNALVLAGGGTKGIYQLGVIEAMRELNLDNWDIITGTSVGALNAMFLVQNDYERMRYMYEHMTADQFVDGYLPSDFGFVRLLRDREELLPALISWGREKGVNIEPFYRMVDTYYDPEKFFASDIDFGCITATAKGHDPVYVTKDMMKERGRDWLVATASAYPAFPVKEIDGKEYVDGGYFDNLPVDFALRLGAEHVTAIDLSHVPHHPNFIKRKDITYIYPHHELFKFLDFDKEKMRKARKLGYLDGMKAFGRYEGLHYTFRHFRQPRFLDVWLRRVLMLETEIKLANNLNEKLYSTQLITDRLKEKTQLPYLDDREYLYAMCDYVMELCRYDDEKVYDMQDVLRSLLEQFADSFREEGEELPSMGVRELASYVRKNGTKWIVSRITHTLAYPEHAVLPQSVLLSLYPFETAAAWFILLAAREYEKNS